MRLRNIGDERLEDLEVRLHFMDTYRISAVDARAHEKTENAINSLKEMKKSSMKHLFTFGATKFDEIEQRALKRGCKLNIPRFFSFVK